MISKECCQNETENEVTTTTEIKIDWNHERYSMNYWFGCVFLRHSDHYQVRGKWKQAFKTIDISTILKCIYWNFKFRMYIWLSWMFDFCQIFPDKTQQSMITYRERERQTTRMIRTKNKKNEICHTEHSTHTPTKNNDKKWKQLKLYQNDDTNDYTLTLQSKHLDIMWEANKFVHLLLEQCFVGTLFSSYCPCDCINYLKLEFRCAIEIAFILMRFDPVDLNTTNEKQIVAWVSISKMVFQVCFILHFLQQMS